MRRKGLPCVGFDPNPIREIPPFPLRKEVLLCRSHCGVPAVLHRHRADRVLWRHCSTRFILYSVRRIGGLLFHRNRQKSNRRNRDDDHGNQKDPEPRLSVIQDIPHSLNHRRFPEGNRARHYQLPTTAALQKGFRVCFFLPQSVTADHSFIAGKLDIPAHQQIGDPHKRIEPENSQEQERRRLPPMVPAAQMAPLMGDHIFPVRLGQTGGQIDLGPEQTQDKGGCHRVTDPDILLIRHRFPHKTPHSEIAEHEMAQHQKNAASPYKRDHRNRGTAADDWIAPFFLRGRRGGIGRDRLRMDQTGVHRLLNDSGGLRDQADRALNGNGNHQSHRHNCPEDTADPPGSFFQQGTEENDRQDQPIRQNADAHKLRKNRFHIHSSPA